MKLPRRQFLQVMAGAGVFLTGAAAAAGDYPTRTITLIGVAGAGGSNDTLARIIADHMAKTLGQPIIIENEGAAGGTVAALRLARAAPDGYTILMGHVGTHGAASAQYPNLKYDPVNDFTPIGLTAEGPVVIVTRKDFPANNLMEFVEYVRKNQGRINEGNGGAGSTTHTFGTLLQSIMATKTARVPYRSGAQTMNDLIGGQIDFTCIAVSGAVSQIQAGTVKAIAVASPERADVIKQVPTTKESGMPEFQVSSWSAMFAPRNLPAEIQAKLNDALVRALDDEATRKRLLELGLVPPSRADRTPQALQKLVESEVARWTVVLKTAGVPAQ
jgi:tripartite-type tricarboxylate transporter receptor subunit TctC